MDVAKFLYEEGSFGVFVLVSVVMGGGAAWLTGSAIAATWRPVWQIAVYTLILGVAVRFLHFALFGGTMLSAHYYVIDTLICLGFGLLGWRMRRVRQMVEQYHWLNERSGALGWRRKSP